MKLLTRTFTTFCSILLCSQAVHSAEKPNIIFIFADDWGWGDLSCHGHPYIKTPNIDRLSREGTDFSRFTVSSGVCSPSRTAVMTGHFPARHNINGHFAWVDSNAKRGMPDWLNPKLVMLPRLLKEAGYKTAHYGKWHLSNNMVLDSPSPLIYGYDETATFNASGEQMPVFEDVQNSIQFIEKSHAEKTPFFINLWMHEPHTPHHVVPKYQQMFPELEDKHNVYASVLAHADDRIGDLLNKLDALGIADNTMIIFSSDNGPASHKAAKSKLEMQYDSATGVGYTTTASMGVTAGRRGCKAHLLEGGIGTPFIVRWPGVVAENTVDNMSLISAVDLLPTFCEIADIDLPTDYKPDGVSKLKVLKGEVQAERNKPLFWKNSSISNSKDKPYNAVVYKKWKLLISHDQKNIELIDYTKDIFEANDLSADYPEVVLELKTMLNNWNKTLPDSADPECFSKHRTIKK